MLNQIIQGSEAIIGIIIALCLAIFAKKYSDLKKRERQAKAKEVDRAIGEVLRDNDALSTDELMQRENKRFWSGFYSRNRKDN